MTRKLNMNDDDKAVFYFHRPGYGGTFAVVPLEGRNWRCDSPSDCIMMIPGTYAQMNADYA